MEAEALLSSLSAPVLGLWTSEVGGRDLTDARRPFSSGVSKDAGLSSAIDNNPKVDFREKKIALY